MIAFEGVEAGAPADATFIPSSRTGSFASALRLTYLEHRTILCLCLGYIVAGGVFLKSVHRAWPVTVVHPFFNAVWVVPSTVWLLWQWAQSPRHLRRALAPPRLCGAVLVALLAVPTQITFQAFKQAIGEVVGFHADRMLYELSVDIHGRMAWEWLTPVLDHPHLVRLLDVTYMSWFPVLLAFALWCSWTRDRVLRQRAITAFLLMWVAAGTVLAALLSSAGPIYYGNVVAGPNPYAPLVSRLNVLNNSGVTLFNRVSEQTLWVHYQHDTWYAFGGISAMPSLHVGIAALYVFIALRRSRALAGLLAAFAVTIQIGSVALGWHYPIDGYAGAALAGGCWWLAGRLQGREALAAARETESVIERTA